MPKEKPRAHHLIGKKLEIPAHFDLWMRGARFGTVTSAARDGSQVLVKMDHPRVKRRIAIREADFDNCRFEDEEQCIYRSREFVADAAVQAMQSEDVESLPLPPDHPGEGADDTGQAPFDL